MSSKPKRKTAAADTADAESRGANRDPRVLGLFDHPDPYQSGAERDEWLALNEALASELAPKGFVERSLVDDVASAVWEVAVLKRVKADMLRLDHGRALKAVLTTCAKGDPKDELSEANHQIEAAEQWAAGDEEAKRSGVERLARYGLQPTAVRAQSYEAKIVTIQAVERLIASALERRDKALHELERVRAVMSIHARDGSRIGAIEAVDDVEPVG